MFHAPGSTFTHVETINPSPTDPPKRVSLIENKSWRASEAASNALGTGGEWKTGWNAREGGSQVGYATWRFSAISKHVGENSGDTILTNGITARSQRYTYCATRSSTRGAHNNLSVAGDGDFLLGERLAHRMWVIEDLFKLLPKATQSYEYD